MFLTHIHLFPVVSIAFQVMNIESLQLFTQEKEWYNENFLKIIQLHRISEEFALPVHRYPPLTLVHRTEFGFLSGT